MRGVVAISRQEWNGSGAAAVVTEKRIRRRELAACGRAYDRRARNGIQCPLREIWRQAHRGR